MPRSVEKRTRPEGVLGWIWRVSRPSGVVPCPRYLKRANRVVVWAKFLSRGDVAAWALAALILCSPLAAAAQNSPNGSTAPDSASLSDSTATLEMATPVEKSLPVYLVLGLGYGDRTDDCILCEAPQDNKSFTGYLSLGRPLGHGFGIGVDASVWRRGRPGTPLAADSTGVPVETSLTNTLGNASVSFSYDFWHLWVRAGGGLAWGSQDLEMLDANGQVMIHTASGWGVGYSAGAGLTVPVASVLSISFFGNWNVGIYDMISPQGLTERKAKHQYLELGAGLAVR